MSRAWKCEICEAPKGEPCVNTIRTDLPLPGRGEHLARVLPPGRSKAKEPPNEMLEGPR